MTQSNLHFTTSSSEIETETLKLRKDGVSGQLVMFTGEQGEFVVSIIPSLNVTGYGKTEDEAQESLGENLDTFFLDLFALTEVERHRELQKLGWIINQYFKHQLSTSYLDSDGVLKNFDFPEKVKRTTLQAA